jgi:hypothetical protein
MKFALNEADKKTLLSPEFLKKCNSLNMEQRGKIQNTLSGVIVDGRRGEFRQDGAFAVAKSSSRKQQGIYICVEKCKRNRSNERFHFVF